MPSYGHAWLLVENRADFQETNENWHKRRRKKNLPFANKIAS